MAYVVPATSGIGVVKSKVTFSNAPVPMLATLTVAESVPVCALGEPPEVAHISIQMFPVGAPVFLRLRITRLSGSDLVGLNDCARMVRAAASRRACPAADPVVLLWSVVSVALVRTR